MDDQEADSWQVTRRKDDEAQKTPSPNRHREESAGSSIHPSHQRPDRSVRLSKQPNRLARLSRGPDDKAIRLEEKLHEMKKQMGDMKNSLKAKAARNLDNLVHRADSPFIPRIANFPLPARFKLSRAFIDHFIGGQRRGRPPTHLLNVKQMEDESLRAYVHRFNKETMQIDRPKEDVTLTAFMARLPKGDFLYDLCKDPLETLSELMYEAQKHMNAEDTIECRDDPLPKRRKDVDDRKQEPTKQKVSKFSETPERKRTTAPSVKFNSFTPLNTPIDQLLMQIEDDPSLRWLGKICSDPNRRPKNLYYRFHKDHSHLTENCMALKEQVETLIRQGKLQKYVGRPPNARPPKPQGLKERTENLKPKPIGEIRTIVRGPAAGGISRTSRKAYARQVHNILVIQRTPKNIRLDDQIISFNEENARGTHQPHDDALVITMNIAGFNTRRVMINNGSSADILYLPAYQQMKLDKEKLQPMEAPLVGFTGDKIYPVAKRRIFAPERNNAIMEEVDKLLITNFIREVFYPNWLANVVMVKKANGKWRMCVDFTDLNKACPKDSFPLPRIDKLVNSTTGHKLLTFMDAFSGHNQIVMDKADQEKTSFITSRGLFCYKVMPFGLKNAGATYQRLMNRMFHDQIGKNVEVYIDDMLVKSKEEGDHLKNLEETFKTLRRYQMKLNPSKCAFGVSSSKFLGFMVSQRGIEANP
uniref:Reverse transcriptase domain-containing protein n=1 Tax=Fagus sylvatica TaxID=28930 RepID=A0A2N9EI37_FAGSY